jgi:hypothetical protein
VATVDTTANLENLAKCKMYEVQIRTICLFDTTSYNKSYILETECDTIIAVKDPIAFLSSFLVYPNPTADVAFLNMIPLETGMHSISIYNMQGMIMDHQSLFGVANQPSTIKLESVNRFPQGLYFVMIEKDGKRATQKLIRL